jgi:hypothetical protein
MQTSIRSFLYQVHQTVFQHRLYFRIALLLVLLALAATGVVLAEGGTGNSICPGCP